LGGEAVAADGDAAVAGDQSTRGRDHSAAGVALDCLQVLAAPRTVGGEGVDAR